MGQFFSSRNLLGGLLFLIFVGEPAVAPHNNLYSFAGVPLYLMYVVLFNLYESIIVRYKLVVFQVFLMTFIFYSVLITGFLHKEIADYVLLKNYFITTMIRIQSSMFTVYALYLLNKYIPRQSGNVLSVKTSSIIALVFILVMSLTGKFGIPYVLFTVIKAPFYALLFVGLALGAWRWIRAYKVQPVYFQSRAFTFFCFLFLILGIVPVQQSFLLLLFLMPIVTGIFLSKREFRNSGL